MLFLVFLKILSRLKKQSTSLTLRHSLLQIFNNYFILFTILLLKRSIRSIFRKESRRLRKLIIIIFFRIFCFTIRRIVICVLVIRNGRWTCRYLIHSLLILIQILFARSWLLIYILGRFLLGVVALRNLNWLS